MNLTPARIEAIYNALKKFPPFCNRKLPEKVKFSVRKTKNMYGCYYVGCEGYEIGISTILCDTLQKVVDTVAHEMVHLILEREGASEDHGNHDAVFNELAAEVCNTLGFNFKEF